MLPSYQKLSQTAYMLRVFEKEIFAVGLKPATEETTRGRIRTAEREAQQFVLSNNKSDYGLNKYTNYPSSLN